MSKCCEYEKMLIFCMVAQIILFFTFFGKSYYVFKLRKRNKNKGINMFFFLISGLGF